MLVNTLINSAEKRKQKLSKGSTKSIKFSKYIFFPKINDLNVMSVIKEKYNILAIRVKVLYELSFLLMLTDSEFNKNSEISKNSNRRSQHNIYLGSYINIELPINITMSSWRDRYYFNYNIFGLNISQSFVFLNKNNKLKRTSFINTFLHSKINFSIKRIIPQSYVASFITGTNKYVKV